MDHKVGIKEDEEEEKESESEEDYEPLVKMTSPVVSNWNDNGVVKGVVLTDDDALLLYDSKSLFNLKFRVNVVDADDDDYNKVTVNDNSTPSINKGKRKRKRQEDDDSTSFPVSDGCPICFEPWTSSYGYHQLCSLPCGHLYGSTCIKKWFLESSSGKCPQCNTLCTLTDVRPLDATCLSISNHKASFSPTTATRQFPFTKEGYQALKDYVLQRQHVALRLARVSSNWCDEVLDRGKDAAERLCFLARRHDELLEEYQTCAHGSRADAFKRRILPLAGRVEALEQRAEVLEQRASAFRRIVKAYSACIDHFSEMCKKLDLDEVLVGSE